MVLLEQDLVIQQATSKDTGSVVFEGGIGVEKNVVIGGDLISDVETQDWNIKLQVTSYRHSQVLIIRYSLTLIQMD